MASTTQKDSKKSKAKLRGSVVKTSAAEQAQTIAELRQQLAESLQRENASAGENVRLSKELQDFRRQFIEGLEQQAATSEVLRVIASSPTQLQPVLDTLIENAVKLSGATMGHVRQFDGEFHRVVAHYGETPEMISALRDHPLPPGPAIPTGRALVEGKTVQILDVQADPRAHLDLARKIGTRTLLMVPLLREGIPIGSLTIWRNFVGAFTDRQIELVKTFANQAVIAIENVRLFHELKESLEQQTATSQILGVIASSPTDIQPVLDVVVENAARLCDATDAAIWRTDGDKFWLVASYGSVRIFRPEEARRMTRGRFVGRTMLDKETIHIHDVSTPEAQAEFPESWETSEIRTVLATPLLREDTAIGAIHIRRTEVRPFSEKQIALLKTFADQAVIAIENVRLFKEIQERNAELREALEHQTATAEVLEIISRSPTDVQPVLDAIVESAARVCGIDDVALRLLEGSSLVARAHFGSIAIRSDAVSSDHPRVAWIREHGTLHISDVRAHDDFPAPASVTHYRTFLAVPLFKRGELIGALMGRRTEVNPFTPAQIKLLETFADQAVIALENVRLFQELKESLEQQTATSEILGVIASSPTDIQPVLDTVIANAVRLVGAKQGHIRLVNGEFLRLAAHCNESDENIASFQARPVPVNSEGFVGRVLRERQPIHVPDAQAEGPGQYVMGKQTGARTMLAVPLLREGTGIGTISIWRDYVEPFTDRQIDLVKTFADQAVIAIENVRLFKELQDRNRQLTEALDQQTAMGEILRVIASSPTDLQPVLDVVAENAAKLCEATDASILRVDRDILRLAASYGSLIPVAEQRPLTRTIPGGRAIIDRQTIHVHDLQEQVEKFPSQARTGGMQGRTRTVLATPLFRERIPIGAIVIRRTEVKPFTDKQIALLKTFADQAVIAIENVRLF